MFAACFWESLRVSLPFMLASKVSGWLRLRVVSPGRHEDENLVPRIAETGWYNPYFSTMFLM